MRKRIFISLALATACVLLSMPRTWAQSDTRVQFPQGRSTVTLEGKVGGNQRSNDYVFFARAGQRLTVHLTSPNRNARFSVIRTKSGVPYEGMEEPLEGAKEVSDWSGALPEEGDYHVYVFPTMESAAPFTVEVTLQQEKVSASDFEGLFELKGRAPKGLEGLKAIVLTTVNFTPEGAVPVKPSGNVRAGGVYKMARVTINGENLSFETLAVRGVSYQFTGKLTRENNATSDDPAASLLKGHLTKSLNGSKMAEADVELESVEGVD
jgi:hypothetical protein